MLDLRAVGRSPCTTCRVVVVAIMLAILAIFHDHGVEEYDFFGLRHYAGAHIPPAADMFLAFVNAAGVWVLCERVIVDRLIRRKPTKDDKLR